jgi:hypothetical protein
VVVGGVYLKAFALQEALQQADQGAVVINDEESVHWLYIAFSDTPVR